VAVQACIAVCPKNPASFNVDNVRVVKIPGGGVTDSAVVRGMVGPICHCLRDSHVWLT
jgi:T-complex protein 1 subunit theta